MKIVSSVITGLIFYSSTSANTGEKRIIDSIIQVSVTAKNDTVRFKALKRLTWAFRNNPEEETYANKALALGAEINYDKGLADIHLTLGAINWGRANYPSALEHYFKALGISERINYRNSIAANLTNIGVVYYDQGNYPKSLEYYFKAVKLDEELGRKPSIARNLNNIGNIYMIQNDYSNALKFYFKALETAKEFDLKQLHAFVLGNIGFVYYKQGKDQNAMKYYFNSLELVKNLGRNNAHIAELYINIGRIYSEQAIKNNDQNERDSLFNKALGYYFSVLAMRTEAGIAGSVSGRIAPTYLNIGSIYIQTKRFEEAATYLDSALTFSESIGDLYTGMEAYEKFSHLYDTTGRYRLAYEYYKKYTAVKDSIFNEDKSKEIGILEAGHEYEKQMLEQEKEHERQQAYATAELKRQKIIGYSFTGGFGLVLILAFFIYRSYRQKKKANQLLEEKNIIIEETHKDITDSIRYAENIQSAILPKEMEINKVLPDHFVYFQPKDIVSGDFYWFTQQNEKVYIAACDCTGHGVPGAFVSMIGNDLLNHIIIEQKMDKPSDILTKLNNGVKSVFTREGAEQEAQDGMDMVLCTFDHDLKSLEFAGAKNPLFIIKKGELIRIKGDSYPIGGETEINYSFTNHKIDLQKGNTIYLLSDGYQDQFGGPKGKKFMIKRFKELLLSIHEKDMSEQKEIIHKTITDWKGDQPQVDDICVIGIRV